MSQTSATSLYFSDVFGVTPEQLAAYGAFDVSLVNDLPLFVDPFLLFNSDKPEYRALHDEVIRYVLFLRDRAAQGTINRGLLESWFTFREVKQTWLGYSKSGNKGRGLGEDFAKALHGNLARVFASFGTEKITRGSHLEKLCLIADGVGKDSISDFTTNLIKPALLAFTQRFALAHLRPDQRKRVSVPKARFNYETGTWAPAQFELPYARDGYVILTPLDMLTKDDVWINRTDLVRDYEHVAASVTNSQLRGQLNHYFSKKLAKIQARDEEKRKAKAELRAKSPRKGKRLLPLERGEPSQKQIDEAAMSAIKEFPEVIDHYIRFKEDHGEQAEALANERVRSSERLFIEQVRALVGLLTNATSFYQASGETRDGTLHRVTELKRIVENGSGRKLLFFDGAPIQREADLHIIMRLVWCNNPPVDALPAEERTPCFSRRVIEIKSAGNSKLGAYLSDVAGRQGDESVKAIICFSRADRAKVRGMLQALRLHERADIVLITAA